VRQSAIEDDEQKGNKNARFLLNIKSVLRRLILQKPFALESGCHSLENAMPTNQQATELQQEFCTHHNIAEYYF
jgi:hypothetical protein